MDAAILTLIGTLIGAFAGIGGSILTTWIQSRSDERKHFRDSAIQIAIQNWKAAETAAERVGGGLMPFDLFLIHAVRLADLASDTRIGEKEMKARLMEIYNLIDAAAAAVDETAKKRKTPTDQST